MLVETVVDSLSHAESLSLSAPKQLVSESQEV